MAILPRSVYSIHETGRASPGKNRLARSPLRGLRTAVVLIVSLLCLLTPLSVHAQSNSAEYQLKAAFIFHFAQLVDWPAVALGPENRPLILCTAGEDSLGGILEATVDGKQIGSRPIAVRHLQGNETLNGCHILFIVGRDKKRVAPILASVKSAPILTVGETDDFVQQGGMIGFCLQDNKIRFDINLNGAQHANLKISSRLLLLAKTVIGDGKQG